MTIQVKICGISEPHTLQAAIEGGARFIGLVFYPPSPRHVSFDTAWTLARMIPTGVRVVGLFVDPDDALLDKIATGIQMDMIQLHGNESAGRVAEIKARYNIPVMKAIRVGSADDLAQLEEFEAAADWLLFDAKVEKKLTPPPFLRGEENIWLPGGTGESFDWNILAGRTFKKPWMLSGGLTCENIQTALSILNPDAVDVSSGVESARGVKDKDKIKAFIQTVKHA
jgi:phosphoribosylanthranilate isomerase